MRPGLDELVETDLFEPDRVLLNDHLTGKREGNIRDFLYVCNGSGKEDWESFYVQEKQFLDQNYCYDEREQLTLADRIFSALLEAIPNFQFHANRGDSNTPLHLYRWRDTTRLYYCIKGEGTFDPRNVRTSWKNPDGSSFQGVHRTVGEYEGIGGLGHIIMATRSEFLMYDKAGTSLIIIFQTSGIPKN